MAQTTYAERMFGATGAASLPAQAGLAIAASALVAICAHISLPLFFTPVPLTMQPFAVLLVGLMLSPVTAFSALALYLVEGAAGLPVFTPHGAGGILQLTGFTAGYLWSYPLVALVVSALWRSGQRNFWRATLAAAAGCALIYVCGASWFGLATQLPAKAVLAQAVVPFLPGDALKVIAAAGIAAGFGRLSKRAG